MNFTKDTLLGLVAIVIALVFGVANINAIAKVTEAVQHVDSTFGGITTGTNFKYGISVGNPTTLGANPTNFSKIISSASGAIIGNTTQTASTTSAYDIAVTGVVSGDIVFAQAATSSAAAGLPMFIVGASASTTSGFITITVLNLGPSAAVPNAIASSTKYLVLGTQ